MVFIRYGKLLICVNVLCVTNCHVNGRMDLVKCLLYSFFNQYLLMFEI